jgi:gamma-glutamyl-gamma-aminobutyrate hydrolase PuuD
MVSLPGEKGAAVQIMSILRGNQMITHPDGAFLFNHVQDVISPLSPPAFHIFISHINDKISQTAFAAATADDIGYPVHIDFIRIKYSY